MVRSLVALVVLCALSLGLFGNVNAAAPIGGGWSSFGFYGSDPDAVALSACKASYGETVNAVRFDGMQGASRYYACRVPANGGTTVGNRLVAPASYCQYGGTPNTSLPLEQQCPDPPAPDTCRGEPSPEAWLNKSGFYPVTNPTCSWMDAEHVNASCSGTSKSGKPTTVEIGCRSGTGLQPGAVPSPEPEVEVDYPECPVGSYSYTDVDGSSECTTPIPEEVQPPPCTSGNVGTVNGNLVCLPANPAPDQAAVAAAEAKLQAAIAKQFPATPQAAEAAKKAAAEAQKAKDAANSLPSSAGAQGSAQDAINSAKQAAGYAGTGYGGPGGVGSGTGTGGEGDTGPKECGTPGKPKCQIDETGTPNGADTKITDEQIKTLTDGREAEMNKKQDSWGLSWNFQLPQGACQPLDFSFKGLGGAFDWCPYLEKLRSLVGYFYVMLTLFGIYASYSNAVKSNKGYGFGI